MRSRHGDSSGGKLCHVNAASVNSDVQGGHTQGLLLEEEEARVQQLQILGEVVQLTIEVSPG